MSNPTANWGWQFPTENQEPWYTAFDTFASAMDTTVQSVYQQPLAPHATLVFSAKPGTGAMSLIGSTTIPDWSVLSDGSYGRWASSFTLINSAPLALFDMRLYGFVNSGYTSWATNGAVIQARLVINPGSIGTFTSDGEFRCAAQGGAMHLSHVFVMSLGQGNYSLEVQGRFLSLAGQSSIWLWSSNVQQVTMLECRS